MHRSSFPWIARFHLLLFLAQPLAAQVPSSLPDQVPQAAVEEDQEPEGANVTLDGEILLTVHAYLGPFSPEERAEASSRRLLRMADDPFYSEDLIRTEKAGLDMRVFYRDEVVGVISPEDARFLNTTPEEAAALVVERLEQAIERYRERRRPEQLLHAEIALGVATVLLVVVLLALRALYRRKIRRAPKQAPVWFQHMVEHRKGISLEAYAVVQRRVLKATWVLATLLTVFVYAQFAFRTIPMTRGYTLAVMQYLLAPLEVIQHGFLTHVGDLFFILVVIVLTHYLLKGLLTLARQASRDALTLPGIAPEWAMPIYKIVRLGVLGLALVMIYPYIPGSRTDAFKGIGLLAGALFTLGATSTAANFIGGIVLIFMRTVRLGDRIRIGDTTGDVIEANLLLTRVRTIKNEVVTIPNSALLGGQLVNYSTKAREEGLIVHTSVTIGYDAPWRKVHDLLIQAALKTSGILETPVPFVLQTALNDFNVGYQINAYTREANNLHMIYGELHQNIQDSFAQGGVEILSPSYHALRDGNADTIPVDAERKDQSPRAFPLRIERSPGGAVEP